MVKALGYKDPSTAIKGHVNNDGGTWAKYPCGQNQCRINTFRDSKHEKIKVPPYVRDNNKVFTCKIIFFFIF